MRYPAHGSSRLRLRFLVAASITVIGPLVLDAQSPAQEYRLSAWNDYYSGLDELGPTEVRAYPIYEQLREYSAKDFQVVVGRTARWGESHPGGVIVLDAGTLQKPKEIRAFIIAHQWAHEALGHQPNIYALASGATGFRLTPPPEERDADVYAGEFLRHAGYDLGPVLAYLRETSEKASTGRGSVGSDRAESVSSGYAVVADATRVGVPCTHIRECEHRSPCIHKGPCTHETVCQHRVRCVHQSPCQHTVWNGTAYVQAHSFDSAHAYDQAHTSDFRHKSDPSHPYDKSHVYDTEHEYDLIQK